VRQLEALWGVDPAWSRPEREPGSDDGDEPEMVETIL
jgi:hypothetical protein